MKKSTFANMQGAGVSLRRSLAVSKNKKKFDMKAYNRKKAKLLRESKWI